jgi:hypothetical protein
MTLSTFLAFLAFLAHKLCFPAPASGRERLEPPTVGPEGDDLSRRSESASAASSLRRPSTRNSDRSASASLARAVPFLAEGT